MVEITETRRPKIIAMCTARGGSRRLPDKNMRLFAGRPLIAWTVIQAVNALCVDEVWVTTDDEGIAEIATRYGAKVKLREKEADDVPGFVPYVNLMREVAAPDDIVIGLFATNPLRKPDDIDRSVKKYLASMDRENKILLSLVPLWESSLYEWVNDDYVQVKSSYTDHPPLYMHAGLLHVSTRAYYEEKIPKEPEGGQVYIIPYEIEPWQKHETDILGRMRLAELIFYDQILSQSLNPYEEYRRGGITL